MSASNYLEDAWLNSLKNTSFAVANCYIKLHTGDPGEAGTSNAAGETTRKAITWGTVSSGSLPQSGTITWTSYSTAETVTHFSVWDNSTAGNCLGAGALSASKTMQVGDTLNLSSITWTVD